MLNAVEQVLGLQVEFGDRFLNFLEGMLDFLLADKRRLCLQRLNPGFQIVIGRHVVSSGSKCFATALRHHRPRDSTRPLAARLDHRISERRWPRLFD
ncbi:hypothetical protein WL77_06685 [Burkholderia ubonensis]|uniref:hypothetical protein n=1 Tax=Burkholderia ubonensis TaxID=101571 RepID=UPI00075D6FF2|nr:hypothetical protein [Burkholderia ubonensis]KWE74592.1 hypothetical protein WL77_06685 [Burkholderia ubonensis]KWE76464.1 hypothetical protein WL79_10015 [Burkholderia ubonensis]